MPNYSPIVAVVTFAFCLLPSAFQALLPSAFPGLLPSNFQDRPTFKAASELVVLHVSVRDRGGRYITGLTQDAFTVIDDAKPQTIEMFSSDAVPASVGFLIDNSNSMRPNRERVVAAAVAFAQHSDPQDEIFVLTFNEQVQEAWHPTIVSEMNTAKFASVMSSAITARGMTAIYDGIMSGLSRLERARHTRQVLIAVSDGGDNASKAKLDDTLKRVHDSDAMIYTVALIDPIVRQEGNPRLLKRLAHATGGEAYQPRRVDEVPEAFERISKDIRNAYTIAYTPTKSGGTDAHRRAVKVYVRSRDGRALTVRTRDGYFEKTREDRQ
ncbi:MAG TPA: VWA domain-containing protein [Vicinamibacterales bacterium]|nr:VWA domain-containing protein [Vicinamibacterales bacterium]